MSDAFTSALTLPEDTSGAIDELKSRGTRFRDRGLYILGVAGAAAVMAIGAFLLYINVQPMTAFSTIDLPALSEAVASITAAPMGFNSPINTAFDSLRGVLSGTLPKALAFGAILISGFIAMASGRISTAVSGLALAFPILFLPTVLDIMAPGGGSSNTQQANGNSFLHQLVDEKRYKELSGAAGELMPSAQAAYVKAQIAYLSQDTDSLKVALESLSNSKLDKWSPDWERMNVLETEAFGSPKTKETVAFADSARSSMDTRQKIFGFGTALAIINSLVGGSMFGFGLMLVRRARRLEEMLGLNRKKEAPSAPVLDDLRSQPIGFEKIEKADWVPAWQRPVQSFTSSPIAPPVTERGCPSMMDGILVGAAGGMVASAILDNDRPAQNQQDSVPAFCHADASPVCADSGDCGAGGCE